MQIQHLDLSMLDRIVAKTRFRSEYEEVRNIIHLFRSVTSFYYVEGDVHLGGLLNPAILEDGFVLQAGARNRDGRGTPYALVINGNLSIDGNIVTMPQNDGECVLIVFGDVRCDNLINHHDCITIVFGDLSVKDVVATNYIDNSMLLLGRLTADVVLSGAGDGSLQLLKLGDGADPAAAIRVKALYNYIGIKNVRSGQERFITEDGFGDAFDLLAGDLVEIDADEEAKLLKSREVLEYMLDGRQLLVRNR